MVFKPIEAKVMYLPTLEVWVNAKVCLEDSKKIIDNFIKDINYYFNGKIIKNDVATTIAEAKIGQKNIIIKRVNAQNVFTIIRRIFCQSRVEKNWKYAGILSQHHIETFIPLLLVKKKCLGVCYLSYLYMSKIEGIEAATYFQTCKQKNQWQEVADNIITLIKKLNNLGLRHRDLNLSNMIVHKKNPYLIDLDAMRLDKVVKKKGSQKEVARFIENIEYLKKENDELFDYFYNALIKE